MAAGEIRSLILNAPPRTGKSLLVSVLYPAWVWCRSTEGPQSGAAVSFFCVSYSSALAEELAVKQRRLCFGAWYQGLWSDQVKMVPDQASRANFANERGGYRLSNSIESGILGRGATTHCYDDLMTVREADSDLERQTILRAMAEGLPTRLNNPTTAARILVGQRVAEDDPTNLALETWTDAVHLMLPARFEVNRCCPQDKRTYEGELLWPEVWPEAELRKVELGLNALEKGQNVLSSTAASAQLQQAPVPRGGGVIPREAWRIWPLKTPEPQDIQRTKTGEYLVQLPEVQHVIVSVDTAFSERETADFSGVVCLGVWSLRREEVTRASPWYGDRWGEPAPAEETAETVEASSQCRIILMEAFATRAPLNDMTLDERTKKPRGLVQRIADLCKRRQAHRVVIENANRGKDTANELRRELHGMEIDVELSTPTASKLARMNSVQPLFSNGLVFSPANLVRTFDKFGREQVDVREFVWVEEVVRQANRCPRGKQDLADALSMGLSVLRRDGWLELTPEFIKIQAEAKAWKPKAGSIVRDIARAYGV